MNGANVEAPPGTSLKSGVESALGRCEQNPVGREVPEVRRKDEGAFVQAREDDGTGIREVHTRRPPLDLIEYLVNERHRNRYDVHPAHPLPQRTDGDRVILESVLS